MTPLRAWRLGENNNLPETPTNSVEEPHLKR